MQDVTGPLRAHEAQQLIRAIMAGNHSVVFSSHALDEMRKDNLGMPDIRNILLRGRAGEAEWEKGRWTYHVTTPRICVVVAFRSEIFLVVVTAWRITR